MERIRFVYTRDDEFSDVSENKSVVMEMRDKDEGGLRCDNICERFVEFMRSAGFSEENIFDYFSE